MGAQSHVRRRLIVAGIGLSSGVIGPPIFAPMVVMTLVTTLVTPLLLRLVFRGESVAGGPLGGGTP